MPKRWDDWLERRKKNSLKLGALALLNVEQLERRDVPSVVYWTGDAGTTHWNDAGNWSTVDPATTNVASQVLPGPTDSVIIDLPSVTVDHAAASQDVISSLQVTAANVTLNLSAGTLDLSGAGGSGTFQVDQTGDVVNLQGGTLKDATVTSGTTIVAGNVAGTLDGVTLDGTLQDGGNATIINGMVLNGSIFAGNSIPSGLPNSSLLTFDDSNGPQELSTTSQGQVVFGPSFATVVVTGDTLTIGAGITIHGGVTAESFAPAQASITGPINNFGNIDDDSGGTIRINFDQGPGSLFTFQGPAGPLVPWTNNGVIEVSSGQLCLGGPWTNNGSITAGSGTILDLGDLWAGPDAIDPNPTGDGWINNGTISTGSTNVTLGGNLTFSSTNLDLAALGLGTDTVSILGSLDNSSHTLVMAPGVTSVTGNWTIGPGQIDGGTIDETAAAVIVESGGTLNGVTLINPPSGGPPSGGGGGGAGGGGPEQPLDPIQSMGPNGRYVDLLYVRLLGRLADVQGGTNFVNALNSGQASQVEVVEAILHSQEYLTREATQLYQAVLGRAPDAGGLNSSVAMLASGASSTQLEAALLGSAEYYGNAGGTNAGFVMALYQTVLGRKADAPGAQNFEQELAGGVSRGTVAQQMLGSAEAVNPEIQSIYETVLNRAVDSEGLAYFGGLLINGSSPQQLFLQLATSSEFAGAVNADVGQLFVTQVYHELLNRAPDPAALTLYAGEIDAGTATRLQIVEAIQSSTEFRTDAVDTLYQTVLGRVSDSGGLAGSLAFLEQGGTPAQLEAILLSSNEFFMAKGGGTDSGFIGALYQVGLNRAVDGSAVQIFGQALSGGASRTTVIEDVFSSAESQTVELNGLYNEFLGRSADPGGLSAALASLQSGASLDQIAAILIASSEYLDRL